MKDYSGPIYEQIDFAYKFVLRNIRLHASFESLERKETYEIPVYAIRELIVNSIAHRLSEDSDNLCYEKKNIMRSRTRKFFFFALFCPSNFS